MSPRFSLIVCAILACALVVPVAGQKPITVEVSSTIEEDGVLIAKADFGIDTVRIHSADVVPCTYSITRFLVPEKKGGLDDIPDLLAEGEPLIDTDPVVCLGLSKALWYDIEFADSNVCDPDSVIGIELGCPTESIAINPRIVKCEGPDIGDECAANTSAYWPVGEADPVFSNLDAFGTDPFSLFSWQAVRPDDDNLIPADFNSEGFLSPVQEGNCINRGQVLPIKVQVCEDGTADDCIPFSDPAGTLFVSFAEVSPCFKGLAVDVPGASTTFLPQLEPQGNGVYGLNWQTPAESFCAEGGESQYSITVVPAGYDLPSLTTVVCAE